MSVPAPFPEARPSKPLRPPFGLPSWQAAAILFFVTFFIPLVNFAIWIAAGFWLVNRWKERGSFPVLVADIVAGTKFARLLHKEGRMELVDSEVGPALRIQTDVPGLGVQVQGQQGAASPQGDPMVLHLELLTAGWVPVRSRQGGEPVVKKAWYKPWIEQPVFLLPLAPYDLEEANRDGLAVRIRCQLKDALVPGQFTAELPGGFLDSAARRPDEPEVRPGLDQDVLPHDICPVCTQTLEGEVVTCQACGASQHAKCLERTGICPAYGCG